MCRSLLVFFMRFGKYKLARTDILFDGSEGLNSDLMTFKSPGKHDISFLIIYNKTTSYITKMRRSKRDFLIEKMKSIINFFNENPKYLKYEGKDFFAHQRSRNIIGIFYLVPGRLPSIKLLIYANPNRVVMQIGTDGSEPSFVYLSTKYVFDSLNNFLLAFDQDEDGNVILPGEARSPDAAHT